MSKEDVEAAKTCAKELVSALFDRIAQTGAAQVEGRQKPLFFPDGVEFLYVNLTIEPTTPKLSFDVKIGGPKAAEHQVKNIFSAAELDEEAESPPDATGT